MKQLIFTRNNEGHLKATIVNNVGLEADGSTIDINDSLLEEARRINIFQEKAYARGYDNMYYRCGDCTLLRVKENQVILIDSYLGDKQTSEFNIDDCVDELDGVWLAEIFKNKSVAIKRSTGHRNSRGIPRMNLSLVTHQGFEKDANGNLRMRTKTTPNHPVELATIIWALNEGRMSTVDFKSNWSFNLNKMQLHHDGFDWDNRLCQTMYLTEQEHTDYHSQVGEWSHQCYCKINTIEELIAFLEFIRCYKATR